MRREAVPHLGTKGRKFILQEGGRPVPSRGSPSKERLGRNLEGKDEVRG